MVLVKNVLPVCVLCVYGLKELDKWNMAGSDEGLKYIEVFIHCLWLTVFTQIP